MNGDRCFLLLSSGSAELDSGEAKGRPPLAQVEIDSDCCRALEVHGWRTNSPAEPQADRSINAVREAHASFCG